VLMRGPDNCFEIAHGDVLIAAITSAALIPPNPSVMLAVTPGKESGTRIDVESKGEKPHSAPFSGVCGYASKVLLRKIKCKAISISFNLVGHGCTNWEIPDRSIRQFNLFLPSSKISLALESDERQVVAHLVRRRFDWRDGLTL